MSTTENVNHELARLYKAALAKGIDKETSATMAAEAAVAAVSAEAAEAVERARAQAVAFINVVAEPGATIAT